eukprot:gene25588-28913_t
MKLALRHAQHAFREDEVPVGAVIVDENGNVLAASRNRVEAHYDATAHAEIVYRLVYGAKDTRLGACGSYVNLLDSKHPFNTIQVTGGLMAEESASLLKRFFRNRRAEGKLIETERGIQIDAADICNDEK